MTEKAIQNYIWENREKLNQLIIEPEFPALFDSVLSEKNKSFDSERALTNLIIKRLKRNFEKVGSLELFGNEVPLKRKNDNTIRADLLGIVDSSALSVIEIKKSKQTERQAFTELLAYSSHIQALFPGMGKEDIMYILISPMEERIVRESVIRTIVFDRYPILCFIPIWQKDDITTLRLKPWIPDLKALLQFSEKCFKKVNFTVKTFSWNNDGKLDSNQLNKISLIAAQLMESKGINGFAFTFQYYPEVKFPDPNSLILVGLNPFQTGKEFIRNKNKIERFFLGDFFDSNKIEEKIYSYESLRSGSTSRLTMIGLKVCKSFSIYPETGDMNWEQFIHQPIENSLAQHFQAYPTGIIRELYESCIIEFKELNSIRYGMPHKNFDYYGNHWLFRDFVDGLVL